MDFEIKDLSIADAKLITPFYREDNRGYMLKCFEKGVYSQWGLETQINENFESYSQKGVIRGMHFQTKEPQIKIVRVIHGMIRDVIVDLRKDSPTFGEYLDVILSGENHLSLWVPRGFAHGFEVLSKDVITSYICIGKYIKDYDTGIRWDDKDLNIQWQTKNPIVSEKDSHLMTFSEFKQIERTF